MVAADKKAVHVSLLLVAASIEPFSPHPNAFPMISTIRDINS
jgi:hypothetical protein